eukprot:CAMPEP_0197040774 /NCGR_PEP_ID=MMETSP1384-20130603/17429_1 /TAXON_ID=29189 /ORGANISM="Ammonia sp." /LENGTH=61 /DNA_ID=CAMNT_0042471593 /DNA_START=19 /DNA_END=204 /DNA_ORIENTATION=+
MITAWTGMPCITIPAVKTKGSKFVAGFEMCTLQNNDEKLLKIAEKVMRVIDRQNGEQKHEL